MVEPRNQEQVLVSRPSSSQWADGSDKSNLAENHQDPVSKGNGRMARGITKHPIGLQDYSTDTNRRDTIQPDLRNKAVILVEVGLASLRREFFDEQSNDDQLKQNLDYLDEVRDQASQRMIKYQ